jgi:signal transduction histidine kinase
MFIPEATYETVALVVAKNLALDLQQSAIAPHALRDLRHQLVFHRSLRGAVLLEALKDASVLSLFGFRK